MGPLINRASFDRVRGYIDRAAQNPKIRVLAGGSCMIRIPSFDSFVDDDSKGYFVAPTVLLTEDLNAESMCEEIFGPVLTVYVYKNVDYDQLVSDFDYYA